MAEYIDREGLMRELGPYEENNFFQEMSVILQIVAGRPAADVAPVVHGRWESHLMPLAYKCSVCGYRPSAKEWRFHKRNFCPNCGARMDKEDNDELDTRNTALNRERRI